MDKMFPLQAGYSRDARPGPLSIPWSVAEKAYGVYAARYGRGQSLERLAERGGFGTNEMDNLYPPWRAEVDEITTLRAERDILLNVCKELLYRFPDLAEILDGGVKQKERAQELIDMARDAVAKSE